MFLHLSVILFTGGSASVDTGRPPPGPGILPWEQTPPGADTPPGTRHHPEQIPLLEADTDNPPPQDQSPPEQTHSPRADTPPRSRHPPPSRRLLLSDGTHPTGMHYCSQSIFVSKISKVLFSFQLISVIKC